MKNRRLLLASAFWLLASSPIALADKPAPPAPAQKTSTDFGDKISELQAKLSLATANPTLNGPLQLKLDIKNNAATDTPKKSIRIWLLVAQVTPTGERVFYTSLHTATPQILPANKSTEISLDATPLLAFSYAAKIDIKNGIPTPADPNAPAAASLGKILDQLAPGEIRVKAFAVVRNETIDEHELTKVDLVATPTLPITLADAPAVDFATLSDADKKAALDQLVKGLHGDAVTAKLAHDRAVKIGPPALAPLLPLVDDKTLPTHGQMWLAATYTDIKDDRTVDPLLKILDRGGRPAQVAAYYAPKLKNPRLTAAVHNLAKTSKDLDLAAWALRGLGIAGEKIDVALMETMVTHSDPEGRAQACEIIAQYSDPKAVALLAKLVNDPEPDVRYQAIIAAYRHDRNEDEMMAAFKTASQSTDAQTKKLGLQALQKLKKK